MLVHSAITTSDPNLPAMDSANRVLVDYAKDGLVTPERLLILSLSLAIILSQTVNAYLTQKKIAKSVNAMTKSDISTGISPDELVEQKAIENQLHLIRGIADCERVEIGLCFNGTSIGKLHFKHVGIFYEAVAPGIAEIATKPGYQRIPVRKIQSELDATNDEYFTQFYYSKAEKGCQIHMVNIGVVAIAAIQLTDNANNIRGLLELHWAHTEADCEQLFADQSSLDQLMRAYHALVRLLQLT